MAYPRKIELALEILAETGMWRSNYAPPLHRLLWSLGIPLRPPHFSTFRGNFLLLCGWIIVVYPLVLWLISDQSIMSIAFQAVFVSIGSSLITAALILRKARKFDLPDWSEIGVAERFD